VDERDPSDLFLSDDPPPRRARPRWLDALGLTVVVGAMVGVGVLGDRGSKDERPTTPTTASTTTTTSPFRRGRPYVSTTSTEPLPTTTTTIGFAPPRFATGSVLLVMGPTDWLLVDVDGGTARQVAVRQGYGAVALEDGFLVPNQADVTFVGLDGEATALPIPTGAQATWFEAGSSGRLWKLRNDETGVSATEIDRQDRSTGRVLRLPAGVNVVGVVRGDFVVSAHGTLALVDSDTGRARALGHGEPVAVGGGRLVRVACQLLDCRYEVVDVATGRVWGIPDLPAAGWFNGGKVSPDGRWVALLLPTETGEVVLRVQALDPGAGDRHWEVPGDGHLSPTFSPDSHVVFAASGGDVCAFTVEGGDVQCLDGVPGASQQVVAARAAG
jgi:hypothetical protein